MWLQRPPPWLAAHLPPTCAHAPTGAYLPATDEEAASTGLPAPALLQCKISGWEWCSKGSTKASIPNLFGPRDQFCGRQFSPQTGWEMVSGWFKCIIFVVQSLSPVQPFVTPWTAALKASLSFPNSQSFLRLMSIMSVMPSSHLILCRPLLLLLSIFPSIRVFSNKLGLPIRRSSASGIRSGELGTPALKSCLPKKSPWQRTPGGWPSQADTPWVSLVKL